MILARNLTIVDLKSMLSILHMNACNYNYKITMPLIPILFTPRFVVCSLFNLYLIWGLTIETLKKAGFRKYSGQQKAFLSRIE